MSEYDPSHSSEAESSPARGRADVGCVDVGEWFVDRGKQKAATVDGMSVCPCVQETSE